MTESNARRGPRKMMLVTASSLIAAGLVHSTSAFAEKGKGVTSKGVTREGILNDQRTDTNVPMSGMGARRSVIARWTR